MKKQTLNEEIRRMQKLAGINENEEFKIMSVDKDGNKVSPIDGNKISKDVNTLNNIISQASDNYLALATNIRDKYPQLLKDPKTVLYINGLAQNIKDLKNLKKSM
jgi:hypothetical protein